MAPYNPWLGFMLFRYLPLLCSSEWITVVVIGWHKLVLTCLIMMNGSVNWLTAWEGEEEKVGLNFAWIYLQLIAAGSIWLHIRFPFRERDALGSPSWWSFCRGFHSLPTDQSQQFWVLQMTLIFILIKRCIMKAGWPDPYTFLPFPTRTPFVFSITWLYN